MILLLLFPIAFVFWWLVNKGINKLLDEMFSPDSFSKESDADHQ